MTDNDANDDAARRKRAERLRRQVADLSRTSAGSADRLPGESDAEYVERRMRELERKPQQSPDE